MRDGGMESGKVAMRCTSKPLVRVKKAGNSLESPNVATATPCVSCRQRCTHSNEFTFPLPVVEILPRLPEFFLCPVST